MIDGRRVSTSDASVVYVLPDKLGGITTNLADLLTRCRSNPFVHHVVLTHNRLSRDIRAGMRLGSDSQVTVEYTLPLENLYAAIRRLADAVPDGPGVLVANDWIELAMVCFGDPGRAVVQIVHGDYDYYYDLAIGHQMVIDAFVALTRTSYEHLRARMPHRRDSIFLLPFGVAIPARTRTSVRGPLRLLFVGRLDHAKGVQDLPLIDQRLEELGIARTWTVVGDGPAAGELDGPWGNRAHVRLLGPRPNREVLELYPVHDVLVLPSRAEGLPRVVLEAMSAGVVPVVSDLACGVREIVEPGVSGYLPRLGDAGGFAEAIEELDQNRDRLETMGLAGRRTICERFDARERAVHYESLYARWRELRRERPKRVPVRFGSRLDQMWLPNTLVYAVRMTRAWLTRKTP